MNPDLSETGSSTFSPATQVDEGVVDRSDKASDKASDKSSVRDGLSPAPSLIPLLELAREEGVDAQSVSHIKLASGNEAGVSIAPAGDGLEVNLEVNLEAYQYLGDGEQEKLCYLFRVLDSEGHLLRYRAEVLLAATSDGVMIQQTKGEPADLDPWLLDKRPSKMPIVREKDSSAPSTPAPMKSKEVTSVSQQKAGGVGDVELPSSKSTFIDLDHNHCTFSLSDFPFQDGSGRPLEWVQITQVPSWGILSIGDSELLAGQDISRDVLDSGALSFYQEDTPLEPGEIEFYFRVSNGLALSKEHRFTLNIPMEADAGFDSSADDPQEVPDVQELHAEEKEVLSPPSVEQTEDEATHVIQDSIEGFEENPLVIFIDRDFSAHHFEGIEIVSLPKKGGVLYNGSPMDTEGFRVSREDLLAGRLKFQPMASELLEGAAGFDYRIVDDELESEVQRFIYGVQADSGSTGALVADDTVEDNTVKDEHNKTLDVSGYFTASDFGGEKPQFEHHVCEGLFGSLSVHQDGTWEYCAPVGQTAFQSLGQNEHLVETIEVASLEGETCQLMILIKGMDHEVVIAGSKCDPVNNSV